MGSDRPSPLKSVGPVGWTAVQGMMTRSHSAPTSAMTFGLRTPSSMPMTARPESTTGGGGGNVGVGVGVGGSGMGVDVGVGKSVGVSVGVGKGVGVSVGVGKS